MSKTVLAFDQASNNTGYAVGRNGQVFECGSINTAPRRFDSIGARFLKLERAVRELIEEHQPALVCIEEHRRHKSVQAAQMLGASSALIMKICEEFGVPYMAVPVLTLKKYWSGVANASKELMVAVAMKKCPKVTVHNDDEADACAICSWGMSQI